MAVLPELWIPAFVFGNLFALFWLSTSFGKGIRIDEALNRILWFWRPVRGRTQSKTPGSRKSVGSLPVASLDKSDARKTATCINAEIPVEQKGQNRPAVATAICLEWRDITCSCKKGNKSRVLLQGISGKAKSKEMMALMGPSGAGKSTLLDILTMRKTTGSVKGEILVNGKPRDAAFIRISSYVPQEDNFVPTMTVHETLSFYANLVLPRGLSRGERLSRVVGILEMMGLSESMHTTIGGLLPGGLSLRGISGGERRRLSIAAGIISDPRVLFLDEPTSGLDSFASLNIIQHLRHVADLNCQSVVISIHQPRLQIWNMFHQILVLSKGLMMYSGSVDQVVPWFSDRLGYSFDASVHGTVPDWVIDLVSIGFNKPKEIYSRSMHTMVDLREAAAKFSKEYERRSTFKQEWSNLELDSPTRFSISLAKPAKEIQEISVNDDDKAGWISQFCSLYWRSFLNITRNPVDVAGRTLTFTYVGLFVGLIFYSLPETADSILSRLNLLYNCAAFYMFIPFISMSLFTSDRQYYNTDVKARLYHPSAYYCSTALAALPFSIANAAIFAAVVYGLAGLRNDYDCFIQHVIILSLESLIAIQAVQFSATVTPNQDMAFMSAIAFTAVNMLLSNFFIPFEHIDLPWVASLRWVSAMAYTWNGITEIEFQDRSFNCSNGASGLLEDVEGAIREGLPNLNHAQAAYSSFTSGPPTDCLVDSDQILDFFNIKTPFNDTIFILFGYYTALHILSFIGLRFISYKDKR